MRGAHNIIKTLGHAIGWEKSEFSDIGERTEKVDTQYSMAMNRRIRTGSFELFKIGTGFQSVGEGYYSKEYYYDNADASKGRCNIALNFTRVAGKRDEVNISASMSVFRNLHSSQPDASAEIHFVGSPKRLKRNLEKNINAIQVRWNGMAKPYIPNR